MRIIWLGRRSFCLTRPPNLLWPNHESRYRLLLSSLRRVILIISLSSLDCDFFGRVTTKPQIIVRQMRGSLLSISTRKKSSPFLAITATWWWPKYICVWEFLIIRPNRWNCTMTHIPSDEGEFRKSPLLRFYAITKHTFTVETLTGMYWRDGGFRW